MDLSATGSAILDTFRLDLHWTLHFAPDVYGYIKMLFFFNFLKNCDFNMLQAFKFNLY